MNDFLKSISIKMPPANPHLNHTGEEFMISVIEHSKITDVYINRPYA